MKILTLSNFIFLMIIVVILHQVIFSTSIPMIIPMENIDTILCSTPQRDVPSHINMNFSSPKAIIPDITDLGPQTNYSPLKNYASWFIYAVTVGSIATCTLEPNTPFLPVFIGTCCGALLGNGIY